MVAKRQFWIVQAFVVLCCVGWTTSIMSQSGSPTISVRVEDTSGNAIPEVFFVIVPVEQPQGVHAPAVFLTTLRAGAVSGSLVAGVTYRITFSTESSGEFVSLDVTGGRLDSSPTEESRGGPRLGSPRNPVFVRVNEQSVGLVVVLNSGGRISGSIASADGSPRYADLGVVVRRSEFIPVADDGTFEFFVDRFPVTLRPEDNDGHWIFEPDQLTITADDDRESIVFNAIREAQERMTVTVVDRITQEPLQDIEVTASWCEGEEQNFRRVVSDPNGTVDLPCIAGCLYRLGVSGGENHLYRLVNRTLLDCDEDVLVELEPGGRIFGKVTDPDSEPGSGLGIGLAREGRTGVHLTQAGSNGEFEFRGLRPGTYRLSLDDPWLVLVDKHHKTPRIIVAKEGPDIEVSLFAIKGGKLCVKAFDADQTPVLLRGMSILDANGELVIQRINAKMGRAVFELCSRSLRPERYLVNIANGVPNFLPSWWPGTVDRALALSVEVKAEETLVLEPLFVTLAGYIRFVFGQVPIDEEWRFEIQDGTEDASSDWLPVNSELVRIVKPNQWRVHVPIGTWNLRLCDDEDCIETALWTSDESTTVATGETVEVSLPKIPPSGVGIDADLEDR